LWGSKGQEGQRERARKNLRCTIHVALELLVVGGDHHAGLANGGFYSLRVGMTGSLQAQAEWFMINITRARCDMMLLWQSEGFL
jgi:hypothetical protein